MSKKKSQKTKGLKAGILAFGAVFALFSTVFHPHSLGGFVLALALSGFAGAIVRTMAQGLDLTVKERTPESLQKVQGDTGNPDVDALLQKGREMITEIRSENDKIPDSSLSEKLDRLENLCAEIFRAVYDKPAKAPQIRKFMEYYLPTTLKMVKGYRMLDERNVSGAEARAARGRIDDALGVVLQGCEKMLDKLYQDDVLDITTDIDVLEQMLKRDGLTESELKRAAEQAREAARIDVETTRVAREREQAAKQAEEAKPVWDSGVRREVEDARNEAQTHIPQAPTLEGGMYPAYGDQAAQLKKPDGQ